MSNKILIKLTNAFPLWVLIASVLSLIYPSIFTWFSGQLITWGLLMSTLRVVIVPIIIGVLMNRYMKKTTEKFLPFAPLVAVIFITLIVASIVGAGRNEILKAGWRLIGAVFSLHAFGFLLGYIFSYMITKQKIPSRTISIEVGMQNSGLGVVLAKENFPTSPLVAIPCAISSVFHSLIASLLAAVWRKDSSK